MKVLMLTLGTRGDVQPYVALALELEKAGHEAVLAAPEMFEKFVSGHGVRFAALDDGPMRVVGTAGGRKAMEGGVRARVALIRRLPKMFDALFEDAWAVASEGAGAGADVVVHNGQVVCGQHVAEALRVPAVLALPIPMYVPTGEFPWPGQSLPAGLPEEGRAPDEALLAALKDETLRSILEEALGLRPKDRRLLLGIARQISPSPGASPTATRAEEGGA